MNLAEIIKDYDFDAPLGEEDAKEILNTVHSRFNYDEGRALLFLYDQIQREFAKGIRCGVCARVDDDDCMERC